jgi:hypothetical protein
MRGFDTSKYNPVYLFIGCFWVAGGVWAAFKFLPTRTLIGDVFLLVIFVLFPISLGVAVIRTQLRLRRKSN